MLQKKEQIHLKMVFENFTLLDFFLFLFPQLSVLADILVTCLKFLGIVVFFMSVFFNFFIWIVPYLVTAVSTNVVKLKNRLTSNTKLNIEFTNQIIVGENQTKKRGKYNRYHKIKSFKTLDECKKWLDKPVSGQLYVYK